MNIATMPVELMLAGWQETHSGGAKVTFWVASEDLEPFKAATVKKGNTAGQRYMAVLVPIGDDDQPERHSDRPRTHALVVSAGAICSEPIFQMFCAGQVEDKAAVAGLSGKDVAAEHIRRFCGVESRAELATDVEAQRLFARLMELYRGWRREQGFQDHE